MLEEHFMADKEVDFQREIEETTRKINVLEKKYDNLVDMRMSGEIDKAKFERYKKRYSPYASIASLYIWAVAGGAIENMKDYKPKIKTSNGKRRKD